MNLNTLPDHSSVLIVEKTIPQAFFLSTSSSAQPLAQGQNPVSPVVTDQAFPLENDQDKPDPLIDRTGDLWIYIGAALLVVSIGFAIRAMSKRVEYALLFAIVLSLLLVLLLITL